VKNKDDSCMKMQSNPHCLKQRWGWIVTSFVLVLVVAFASDGTDKVVALEGAPHVIKISPAREGRAFTVAYSPDGGILAVGSSLGIQLFTSSDLQLSRFIPTKSWVRALAFSPDGSLLASGSYDSTVRLWSPSNGTLWRKLTGHSGWVRALAFSPDGRLLATASDDNTVRLWRVADGTAVRIYDQRTAGVRSVAFSPDGQLLATGGYDKVIRLWSVTDGNLVKELAGHTNWVRCLAFSPDGAWLASGGFDATVRLWRVADGKLVKTVQEHSSSVLGLAFSPDGSLLASASVDTTVRLWTMPALESYDLLKDHTDFVYGVAFSPDGKSLASAAADNTVRVWSVRQAANPSANEIVSSPKNCVACHHPRGLTLPARVIETTCATCHQDGALVLDWCPALPRSPGGTTVQVSNNIQGEKVGVPQATPDLGIVIATPGNGQHVYSPQSILTLIPIDGYVFSASIPPTEIELHLEIWSASRRVALMSAKPSADGKFSFAVNVRPEGSEPFPGTVGRQYCLGCHKESTTVLPAHEVRLLVTAVAPDGRRAIDERSIYVDNSATVLLPVQVLQENGQPASNIPVQAETRLYEWRGRLFNAVSDSEGKAVLPIESLSQIPTVYQVSVPAVVLDGVLYESVEPVQVSLSAEANSAPEVTIYVRARSGQISGQVVGASNSIQLWAIHLPDGSARQAKTTPQGSFSFMDLPIGQYLFTADPQPLAAQGLALKPQELDLTQSPDADMSLSTKPLEGQILRGNVSDANGAELPFAWLSTETQTASIDPVSGTYFMDGLSDDKVAVTASAPGYYSQVQVVTISQPGAATLDFRLARRPETRVLPLGGGSLVLPPETTVSPNGNHLTFNSGWLWGSGDVDQTLVIQVGKAQISVYSGSFALSGTASQSAWLYQFSGQASVQWVGASNPVTVGAGQMILLSNQAHPLPVAYDPLVIQALQPVGEVPLSPTWQPTIGAQIQARLAQVSIGTAQVVTFVTYSLMFLLVVGLPLIGIYLFVKRKRIQEVKQDLD
jgi:WD40 repeat protein